MAFWPAGGGLADFVAARELTAPAIPPQNFLAQLLIRFAGEAFSLSLGILTSRARYNVLEKLFSLRSWKQTDQPMNGQQQRSGFRSSYSSAVCHGKALQGLIREQGETSGRVGPVAGNKKREQVQSSHPLPIYQMLSRVTVYQ